MFRSPSQSLVFNFKVGTQYEVHVQLLLLLSFIYTLLFLSSFVPCVFKFKGGDLRKKATWKFVFYLAGVLDKNPGNRESKEQTIPVKQRVKEQTIYLINDFFKLRRP